MGWTWSSGEPFIMNQPTVGHSPCGFRILEREGPDGILPEFRL